MRHGDTGQELHARVVLDATVLDRLTGVPDPDALYRGNVDGTLHVVRAAAAAGALRVVYTSSAATIGEEAGTVGSEASPHRGRFLSHYERSK